MCHCFIQISNSTPFDVNICLLHLQCWCYILIFHILTYLLLFGQLCSQLLSNFKTIKYNKVYQFILLINRFFLGFSETLTLYIAKYLQPYDSHVQQKSKIFLQLQRQVLPVKLFPLTVDFLQCLCLYKSVAFFSPRPPPK